MKDPEKRRRVMQRSMQLGHCICDPKTACPCEFFLREDICPCAGEEYAPPAGPVRLTELVHTAGCGSKIDQASLQRILAGLPSSDDPRVLVGMPAGDDAGVYLLDAETALVQTVNVFSPPVDDPYLFGQIAAANSLSDVYAMGGRPLTALSVVGFPARKLPDEILHQILRGGLDKMAEAGVAVIGGHSIQDDQIMAGFAVTGLVDPRRIATNAAARPGDRLVLTKPLGTGIIIFAGQIGRASAAATAAAAQSMAALNRRAAELMADFDAHACTNVTGFGLMGHLKAMAVASGVDIELDGDAVPLLPGVLQLAAEGVLPGAVERNKESSGDALAAADGATPALVEHPLRCPDLGRIADRGAGVGRRGLYQPVARRRHRGGGGRRPGHGRGDGRIVVRGEGRPTAAQASAPAETPDSQETSSMSCCEHGSGGHPAEKAAPAGKADAAAGSEDIQGKFQAFLGAANAPGRLGARTKRAAAIALSVLARCAPCVKHHVRKAQEEGFTPEEIDEAAWLAIAFGGSPAMMFYNETKKNP